MAQPQVDEINQLINTSQTVLIIGSMPLDFDCLGSGLVLKKYLESLGKRVTLCYPKTLTQTDIDYYSFLPYFDEVIASDTREILGKKNFDLLIVVDGPNWMQFYDSDTTPDNPPDRSIYPDRIQFDHHLINAEQLGTLAILDPKSSSTMEVLLKNIIPSDFFDEKTATLAYGALVGDTGNFRWNFNSETLKYAGLLVEKGANTLLVVDRYCFRKSKRYLEMMELALKEKEYIDEIESVLLALPYQKFKQYGIDDERYADLKAAFLEEVCRLVPEYPRGLFIYEREPGKIGIQGRGNNLTNQVSLPLLFASISGNSGGHFNAAGMRTEGDFEEIRKKLVEAVRERLNNPQA